MYGAFFTISRVQKLAEPTEDVGALRGAAVALLDRVDLTRRIRLLGVRADLEPPPTSPTRGRAGDEFSTRPPSNLVPPW